MGGKQAAEVLAQVKNGRKPYTERWNKTEEESFKSKIKTKFDTESSALYTSARLLDDGVIDPKDTRKFLILGLTLIYQEPITASNHGIFRM